MQTARLQVNDVRTRLAAAPSVVAAAETVMDLCLDAGLELPSIYFERGGRLRCIAQRGYWQVYDGLSPGAGVLGSTYAAGRTQVVQDASTRPDFIRAIPSVVAEACVPVVVDQRTVGALNVESRQTLAENDVAWVETLARLFGDRVAELGGPPAETPAEQLARLGYELATLDDGADIARHAMAAAVMVADMSGACIFLTLGDTIQSVADQTRLGRMLAALPSEALDQLVDYVARATSSWADGRCDGDSFEATHILRGHGVGSLVVLALVAKGRREGILVLADERPRPALASVMPLLELLASTAAAMIVAAETSSALQRSERVLAHQARHDPLTRVANRGHLLEQMRRHLADDRERAGLVVLFVDLDGFKEVNDRLGHQAGDQLLVAVADRLQHAARASDLVARLGGDEFVVLCLGVVSISEATAVCERILSRLDTEYRLGEVSVTLSACIGIAAAAEHTRAEGVLEAADRAMYAAKSTGPGTWVVAEPEGLLDRSSGP